MAFKNNEEAARTGMIIADNPFSIVSEQFRTIRTNIQFSMIDEELQTLTVTSATASSGKSTVSSNLAGAFAAEGSKVLLVDTDMRKPTIHKIFRLQNNHGLTNVLTNRNLKLSDAIHQSYVENLDILTCGVIPPNPSELIGSKRMVELIEQMKELYDLIIFDTPPLLAVTDSQIISTKVDGTIIVVPQGEVRNDELETAAELLKKVKANVLGTVLNKVETNSDSYYYYGSE